MLAKYIQGLNFGLCTFKILNRSQSRTVQAWNLYGVQKKLFAFLTAESRSGSCWAATSQSDCKVICLQGSSIVLVTSSAGYVPEPPISLYGVTKTALVSLGKALANELGPEGIHVNCIAPGNKLEFCPETIQSFDWF